MRASQFISSSKREMRKPEKLEKSLAFMWESRYVFRPTQAAMNARERQKDYDRVWDGFEIGDRLRFPGKPR